MVLCLRPSSFCVVLVICNGVMNRPSYPRAHHPYRGAGKEYVQCADVLGIHGLLVLCGQETEVYDDVLRQSMKISVEMIASLHSRFRIEPFMIRDEMIVIQTLAVKVEQKSSVKDVYRLDALLMLRFRPVHNGRLGLFTSNDRTAAE